MSKIIHVAGYPGSGKTTIAEFYKYLQPKGVFVLDLDDITVKMIDKSKINDDPKKIVDNFNEKYNKLIGSKINNSSVIIIVGIVNDFHTKKYVTMNYHLEDTKFPPHDKIFLNISFSKLANQIQQRSCGSSHNLSKKNYMLKHYRNYVAGGSVGDGSVFGGSVYDGSVVTDYDFYLIKKIKDNTQPDIKYYVEDRKYVPMQQMEIIDYINKNYLYKQIKPIALPTVVEILTSYNLDMKWFLHHYLEYKFPNRKIYDAYNTIYKMYVEAGDIKYPSEPCIIISPTLLICTEEKCQGNKLRYKGDDYMSIVITQKGGKNQDICTYDDKKINKLFYKNEYIILTKSQGQEADDDKMLSITGNHTYEFYSVAELIYNLSIATLSDL